MNWAVYVTVTRVVFEYRSGTQSLPCQKAKAPESSGEEALASPFLLELSRMRFHPRKDLMGFQSTFRKVGKQWHHDRHLYNIK